MEPRSLSKLVDRWPGPAPELGFGAPGPGPGATLGRYELLLPIGMGGMACVWAARLEGYGGFSKVVAVKTILPHFASDPNFERMLLDEARIAADLQHPNVCCLFDAGEEHGTLYLVMEWVNGDALVHILRGDGPPHSRQALDPRIAARIVGEACAGLHAAHELSDSSGRPLHVVHRDVSPHNILVSLDGTVKIADFGVAKAEGQLHQPTRTGELRGKIAYMAPEQIAGGVIDRRADIFAMGCVLYEATTGQQPFRGENEAQVMRAVLDGTHVRPDQLVPGYAPELAGIVERALEPAPEGRFQTAEALRVALEEWLARSGCVLAGKQIGDVVRERIGPKLARRWSDVRAAMEGPRGGDSTRRVLARASEAPRLPAGPPPPAAAPENESPAPEPAVLRANGRHQWLTGVAAVATLVAILAVAWTVVSATRPRAVNVTVIGAPDPTVTHTTGAPPPSVLFGGDKGVPAPSAAAPVVSAAASASAQEEAINVDTPKRPTTPAPAKHVAVADAPAGAATRAPPAPRVAASAAISSRKSACNPAWTVDAEGIRHPKLECF
jgi:serine/threonine-protein kinase